MGTIEKNFLNDGFKLTYYDGVTERFHKNLLDDNYRGDKGSTITSHWLDDGFTVSKYDGTKESFQVRDSKEFLAGDKGTRIREGFWGDYYVSENPYAGYKPPTIADARKAKYQETAIRAYLIDRNNETTLEELKNDFLDIIEASGIQVHLADVTVNGNPAVAIVSNTNPSYMPVCCYFATEDGKYAIVATVSGKGQQTNASELSKLYYKAASPWGKLQIRASRGGSMANYFGYSVRAGGAIGGIGAITGMAISGGLKLAAKGVKVLLRDNDAYRQEMDFYNQAAGIIDYAVGYNDSYDLQKMILERANNGLPVAQYQMGIAYVLGISVEANEDASLTWFAQAAESGELRSQNIIAGEYLYNTEKSYTIEQKNKGVYYLYNLASFGEDWAGELLIDIYGRNSVEGIEPDIGEAVRIAETLSEGDNLHAIDYLASVYDRRITADNPSGYENDTKAFECYDRMLTLDGSKAEELSMMLASMCKSGFGTERSDVMAVRYYDIASSRGNLEAKRNLLEAYTLGKGVERSTVKVKSLSKELLRSKNEGYVSEAKYYLSVNADKEEQYGKALKYAHEYIGGNQTDTDKVNYLTKYIADMEERISGMSEEERREYLKEPKRIQIDLKNKRWIIIVMTAVIAVVIALVIFNKLHDNTADFNVGKSDNKVIEAAESGDSQAIPDDAVPVLEAYNELLSEYSFDRNGFESGEYETREEIWYTEDCTFNIAYIDEDNLPELIIYNQASDHASGWGQIYTFENNGIMSAGRISSPIGANDVIGAEEGYYEKSGWYMDFPMWQGYGSLNLCNIHSLEHTDTISMNYEPDEDFNTQLVGYSIGVDECSEEEYYRALEDAVGDAEFIPYVFFDNTPSNRETILGVESQNETSDENTADSGYGSFRNNEPDLYYGSDIESEEQAMELAYEYRDELYGWRAEGIDIYCWGATELGYLIKSYEDEYNDEGQLFDVIVTHDGYLYNQHYNN